MSKEGGDRFVVPVPWIVVRRRGLAQPHPLMGAPARQAPARETGRPAGEPPPTHPRRPAGGARPLWMPPAPPSRRGWPERRPADSGPARTTAPAMAIAPATVNANAPAVPAPARLDRISVGAVGSCMVLVVSAAWGTGVIYHIARLGVAPPVR